VAHSDGDHAATDRELDELVWDADESWVVAVGDDDFAVDLPIGVERFVRARLEQGAQAFKGDVGVTTGDDEGEDVRQLEEHEVASLIDTAAGTCRHALDAAVLDPGELLATTQAASLLTTIWSIGLDVDDWDPVPLRREQRWVEAISKLAHDGEYMLFARIRPRRDGTFSLRWRPADRDVVRGAADELRALLSTDDPSISRLFPSAYGSDGERNAGWDVLMRGELIERRLATLAVVEDLLGRDRCTAEELDAFMRAVNDARLVIGTRLDVDESGMPADVGDADRAAWLAYEHLGFLLSVAIHALYGTL